MGKKNRKAQRSAELPKDESADSRSEDNASFAQSLLSNMGLESNKSESSLVADESAIQETDDSTTDFETRHPHLSSIHRGLSKVFRKDSSKTDSESNSETASRSGSASRSRPDLGLIPESSGPPQPSGSAKESGSKESSPADRAERVLESKSRETDSIEPKQDTQGTTNTPGKKRNRRKEKLAERERERARIVQEAQAEAETDVDKRAIELKGMGMMITKAGLVEFEVQPDGHCLFHSLSDQLKVRRDIEVTVPELRKNLADYIRKHPDDFIPYLIEDETGDVVDIKTYTADLETTPLWGGDLEIMAASCLYETPVRVHFGSQAPLDINEERFSHTKPLHLAFYQAKFGLGAHYNSLRDGPAESAPDELKN